MLGPVLLIVIGVLFLLNNMFPNFRFGKMWPVILIVIGLAKVFEYFQANPPASQQNASEPAEQRHAEERKEGE
jgi:hypothetical protein